MEFKDKVVLITGAGSGIGRGIAIEFEKLNAKIAIADIDEKLGKETAGKIKDSKGIAIHVKIDVSDAESVDTGVKKILDKFGQIDILVNNAGTEQRITSLCELTEEEWRKVLDVNLTGMFLCSKVVAGHMKKRERGKIVNISSINGVSPAPFAGAYNVSKTGVISLTKTFAYELAPYNINVNAVCPGPVHTKFTDKVMTQRSAMLGITKEEIEERIKNSIPLGRWGTPEDIAKAIIFFSSDYASWITGEVLIVSGGLSGVSGVVARKK